MSEWVLISPVLTVLVGACAAMISHALHPQRNGNIAIKIAAFSLLAAGIQIALLGHRAYGLSPSGLFRIDGMSLGFAMIATLFLSLGIGSLCQERNGTWPYCSPAALILATTTFAGLFANDGLLLFLSLSTLLIFIRWPTSIWAIESESRNDKTDILGIIGWFVFAGFCMTILMQTVGSGRYDVIEQARFAHLAEAPFHIGIIGLLFVHAIGFLPSPVDPYIEKAPRLGHWAGVAFAKTVVPMIFLLLAVRWMWLFGFDKDLMPTTQVDLGVVVGLFLVGLSALGIWVLISEQSSLRVVTHFSLSSLALGLVPFFLNDPKLLNVGFSHMCIVGLVTFIVWASFSEMEISTSASFSRLKEAAQNATVRVQLMLAFGLLGLTFPFGEPANLLIKRLWLKAAEVPSPVTVMCAILLVLLAANVLLMCIRIVQIFAMDAGRNMTWEGGRVDQKIWAYGLLIAVLILGVHPVPLYNYFAHSIRLLLKAN